MKYFYVIFILFLTSCQEQADFYKNGIPYRIEKTCLDKHKEYFQTKCYSRYYGYYDCTSYEWVCTREKIDTIEVAAPRL